MSLDPPIRDGDREQTGAGDTEHEAERKHAVGLVVVQGACDAIPQEVEGNGEERKQNQRDYEDTTIRDRWPIATSAR